MRISISRKIYTGCFPFSFSGNSFFLQDAAHTGYQMRKKDYANTAV